MMGFNYIFPQLPFSLLSDPVNISLLQTHELEKYLFIYLCQPTESSEWYMNMGHLPEHSNLQRGCAVGEKMLLPPLVPVTCQ